MAKGSFLFLIGNLIFLLFLMPGCNKEEKASNDKNVTRRTFDADARIYPPRPDKIQHIKGVISRVERDVKTVWIQVPKWRDYGTLAKALAIGNRNDEKQELKISLEFVTPLGSITSGAKFRTSWRSHVHKILTKELVEQTVLVDLRYEEKAKKFWGTLHKVITTTEGKRVRNINRWMISEGLSYYIIDRGRSPQNIEFENAQSLAKQRKAGLWNYQ